MCQVYTYSIPGVFAQGAKHPLLDCLSFHVSIKDLRICANNPAVEDFVIKITIRMDQYIPRGVYFIILMDCVERKPEVATCEHKRRRPAYTSAQSDQRLYCLLPGKYN